ncbi:prolyl oligopeptidase family serine peptidase [Maricaulaceae bacterium NA33B04]|nr:prolyl oligopeptidase family serine peptidase [Maricaulaceae bacterium NA33B04]
MRRYGLACTAAVAALAIAACSPSGESEGDTMTETAEAEVPAAGAELNAAIQAETESLVWLEEVEGERALEFAMGMNEPTLERLQADPRYQELKDSALEVLQSSDRIAYVGVRGGELWNFWRDADNTHGLWRKTTVESYATDNPEWDVVLDLDALADEEDKNWVWRGSSCLAPDYNRCILTLSDGGSDAAVRREWDMETRSFVEDGFEIEETKGSTAWIDEDTLLIATALDTAEATTSGYPFVVKRWERGTDIADATPVLTGAADNVGVWPARFEAADGTAYMAAIQSESFFEQVYWYLPDGATGEPVQFPLPRRVTPYGLFGDQLVFGLDQDWTPVEGGETYPAGAVMSYSMSAFAASGELPQLHEVFVPNARQSVGSVATTADNLLMVINDNVVGTLNAFQFGEDGWTWRAIDAPENASISIVTADDQGDLAYVNVEGFLTPETLYRLTPELELETAKSAPSWFETEGLVVEQREATSADGTQVPYFILRSENATEAGPTLLYAYGGFQVSLNPNYSGTLGRMWLEQGGTYVLANIRGGGEFGPAWHQAGLRTNRQRIYDDLIAVAEQLIDDGVTTAGQLGVEGGSNGGLLTGVMYTQRPDLFGAVISQVPLLDMLRYHTMLAGASWQDEYGFPDENPEEREFLRSISPFHNVETGGDYPPIFLLTSTKDDRVHPAHARKMAYLLNELGEEVLYYENMEGGHSAAANLEETANRLSLEFTFLMQELMDE